ncbi:MAG: transposase [Proteobacteria bacterium]|nr:transposase [Pseudomonadota bacterium]
MLPATRPGSARRPICRNARIIRAARLGRFQLLSPPRWRRSHHPHSRASRRARHAQHQTRTEPARECLGTRTDSRERNITRQCHTKIPRRSHHRRPRRNRPAPTVRRSPRPLPHPRRHPLSTPHRDDRQRQHHQIPRRISPHQKLTYVAPRGPTAINASRSATTHPNRPRITTVILPLPASRHRYNTRELEPENPSDFTIRGPSNNVILITERRRRWRDENKLRIVAEVEAPGAVFALVARRHEISQAQ